jgi:two-component system, cell cycle sensor histidine kinase and response regulator CckA
MVGTNTLNSPEILYCANRHPPPDEYHRLARTYPAVSYVKPPDLIPKFNQYILTLLRETGKAPGLVIIYDARNIEATIAFSRLAQFFKEYDHSAHFSANLVFLLNSAQRADFEEKQDQVPLNCQFFYADQQSWQTLEAKLKHYTNMFKGYRGLIQGLVESTDYQRQFEHSYDAIITGDISGDIRSWNPGATRVFGWTGKEAIGQSYRNLLKILVPSTSEVEVAIGNKGFWAGEIEQTTKSGALIITSTTVSLVRNFEGNPVAFIVISRDITEVRQKEEALAARTRELSLANKLLSGLINEAPIGIAIFNAEGFVNIANPAFMKMCGVGDPALFIRHFNLRHLPELASYEPYLSKAFSGEAVNFYLKLNLDYFTKLLDTRGGRATFNVYLFPVRDGENTEVSVVSFVINETEAKNLQRQLEHAQKLRSIGTLAGGIAHDFNNMLTALFLLITSVREKVEPDSPIQTELEELNQLGKQANGLTERLLLFTRQKLESAEPSPFNRIVLDSGSLLRRTISEDIEFKVEIDDTIGMVVASSSQLSQVLVNLVINARDALKDAELSQKFSHQSKQIKVSTFKVYLAEATTRVIHPSLEALGFEVKAGWYAACRIADNGTGITPENIPLIFDPFYTSKEPGRGSGLGLPICYNVIKNYEGWLELDNKPGEGAAFTFYVPLLNDNAVVSPVAPARNEPQISVSAVEPKPPQEITVLLVEDEEILRVVTTRMLKKIGYQVLTAKNGVDAFEVYQQNKGNIDIVLTDTVMPEMGGVELIKKLIENKGELKVVLMSGYVEGDDALRHTENVIQIPSVNFIAKPFKINQLEDIINKSLGY